MGGAFGADGLSLAALVSGGDVVVWDLATGAQRVVETRTAHAIRAAPGGFSVATPSALVTVPDDLPREPDALLDAIRTATRR